METKSNQVVNSFIEKSNRFFEKHSHNEHLPKANRVANIIADSRGSTEEVQKCIENTYPIVDAKTKDACVNFLTYKREHGSDIEKALYDSLTVEQFYTRLLQKRPYLFVGSKDTYMLRSEHGCQMEDDGRAAFDAIGTDRESGDITLENYLSYDEMELSSLVGLSSPTIFINDGNRRNMARLTELPYEKTGISVGLVGPRFERPCKMEYRYIIVDPTQNTATNGYGGTHKQNSPSANRAKRMEHLAELYGVKHFPAYHQAATDTSGNYYRVEIPGKDKPFYLNKAAYKARMRAVIAPFLADANQRAMGEGKKAYLHIVGLGLGAWRYLYNEGGEPIAEIDEKLLTTLQLEVYDELLRPKEGSAELPYPHISTLYFSYFPQGIESSSQIGAGIKNLPSRHIKFGNRNPADSLPDDDNSKLLIVAYPWDGNAYPGNEYWAHNPDGQSTLSMSGDPAAVSCCIIGETQNPEINTTQVCGEKVVVYPSNDFSDQHVNSLQTASLTLPTDVPIAISSLSERAKENIQIIAKIAAEFEENENPEISQVNFNKLRNALNGFSKNDLIGIQEALQQETGLFLNVSIAEMQSPKARATALKAAMEAKKQPQETMVAPIGTVTCSYFERANYDYFSVTSSGDVICLVPFMSCNEFNISSENTCKTGETMIAAMFGKNGQGPRIIEILNTYIRDLVNDFQFFDVLNNKDNAKCDLEIYLCMATDELEGGAVLQGKIKRYLQLKQYQKILEQVISDSMLKNDLVDSDMSQVQLPKPVRQALEKSNAVSFLIAPQMKSGDPFLRLTPMNLFSLERKHIWKAGSSQLNPKYNTGFVVSLRNSLNSRSAKLKQKKPSTTLTKEALLSEISKAYLNLTNQTSTNDEILVRDAQDLSGLRTAVLSVLQTLNLSNFEDIKSQIEGPYFDKYNGTTIPNDTALFTFIQDTICLGETPTIGFCLECIFDEGQQEECTKEPSRSPFDEPTVTSTAQYNELIQIFLASACFCYYEYTHSDGLSQERINFGKRIENDVEPISGTFSSFFTSSPKKQVSLIKAIEKAIDEKLSLENAILDWLEAHILSAQTDKNLKKFTPQTKEKIKNLFRAQWQTFYDPESPAPHIDEFLIAMANPRVALASPQVVVYRGTMALPLDIFCKYYEGKPWLEKEFIENDFYISLPKASALILEDGITVPSTASNIASCELKIDAMACLVKLIEKDPRATAEFLLKKTIEGKAIYSLLNQSEVEHLAGHSKWAVVLNHAITLLSAVSNSEAEKFKTKFDLKSSLHITRELEHALYAHYGKRYSLGELKMSRQEKVIDILKKVCGLTEINIEKTAFSTFIVKLELSQKATLQKIYQDNKTCIHITPEMAASFYKQVGDTGQDANLISKPTRVVSSHGNQLLTQDSKLPLTIKALFPDLTVVIRSNGHITQIPENKTERSPDVIIIEFNPVNSTYGYQVTSSNPDNLYRIRDCYELSITRTLSGLEAGKILQAAVNKKQFLKTPVKLSAEMLEEALDALGIIYHSVVEVGRTYQIVCDSGQWENLKNAKKDINVDPNLVNPGRVVVSPATVKAFFAAIAELKIEEAKRLLSEYPELLNTKDETYQSVPLISALTLARKYSDDQSLLEFCLYLIEQPAIEIAHADQAGNTALHKAIFYADRYRAALPSPHSCAHSPSAQGQYDQISLTLWEKARKEGTQEYFLKAQNVRGESIFGGMYQYDFDKRVRKKFAQQTFWNLLTESRYYNFQPAWEHLQKASLDLGLGDDFSKELINQKHPKENKFLLHLAIERGDVEGVKRLIQLRADVNATLDGDEFTQHPLGLAMALKENKKGTDLEKKFNSIVEILLKEGASLSYFMEAINNLKQQFTTLTEKYDALQQSPAILQQQQQQLETSVEAQKQNISALEAQLLQLNQTLFEQGEELKTRLDTQQKTAEALDKAQKENQTLQQALEEQTRYSQEIQEKLLDLDQLSQQHSDLQQRIQEQQQKTLELEARLTAQTTLLDGKQKDLEIIDKNVQEKTEALALMQEKEKELENLLDIQDKLTEKLEKINQTIAQAQEELPKKEQALEEQQAKLQQIDQELQGENAVYKKLQKELQQKAQEKQKLAELVIEKNRLAEPLTQESNQLVQRIQPLTQESNQLTQQNQQLGQHAQLKKPKISVYSKFFGTILGAICSAILFPLLRNPIARIFQWGAGNITGTEAIKSFFFWPFTPILGLIHGGREGAKKGIWAGLTASRDAIPQVVIPSEARDLHLLNVDVDAKGVENGERKIFPTLFGTGIFTLVLAASILLSIFVPGIFPLFGALIPAGIDLVTSTVLVSLYVSVAVNFLATVLTGIYKCFANNDNSTLRLVEVEDDAEGYSEVLTEKCGSTTMDHLDLGAFHLLFGTAPERDSCFSSVSDVSGPKNAKVL